MTLGEIGDWPERASKARYNASQLAKSGGVSLRQLERFFQREKGVCPKVWLAQLRDQRALELMKESVSLKQIAETLGYRNSAHFSHDFRKRHGLSPSEFSRSNSQVSRFDNSFGSVLSWDSVNHQHGILVGARTCNSVVTRM